VAGAAGLDQAVDGAGAAIGIQLQEKQVRDNQYFVVRRSQHTRTGLAICLGF
jgi:hypothetical protein